MADLDGTRSPLAPSWIDLGDWGQERVASQKEARVEEKKKNLSNFGAGLQSLCCFCSRPDQSRLHRPLSGPRVSSRLGDSVSTPRRHSFQSECAAERVFKNSPSALREQLLSGVIKTEAEGDVPRSPEGWGGGGGGGRPFPAVKVFNQ